MKLTSRDLALQRERGRLNTVSEEESTEVENFGVLNRLLGLLRLQMRLGKLLRSTQIGAERSIVTVNTTAHDP